MPRTTVLLFALVALLGAGFVWVANRPATQLSEAQVAEILALKSGPDAAAVTQIVADILAKQKVEEPPHSDAVIDADTLNPLIESYLLENPSILQRSRPPSTPRSRPPRPRRPKRRCSRSRR